MTARKLAAAALCVVIGLTASAAAQVQDWPSERPPRPLPARDVKFPPYAMRTLANGLQVIAVSHHEQPAVSLRLIVRAGGVQDPPDKPGVASLAAALLDQGTTTKDAEQIATSIDSIGGALGTGASSDLTSISAIVMKDSLDVGLDLVSDVVRNPKFADEELQRQRQQILSSLKVSYDDPDYLAGVVFDRLVYGLHPYGRPDNGTPASIASITRDDLLAFHRKWFGANNAILAIVGDVSPEEAFAGAQRAFGNWPRAESSGAKVAPPPSPTRRVIVVDRPGAVQTEIRVGNIGVPRKHRDYMALDLAIKILGGEGGNRLHRVLRSERGLTYGASADINALNETGDIVADTDTRSETTGEALRLMVDEFWRLQRQPVEQRELADAQAYLTGSFPLTIETPSAIALQVLHAVFFGLDLNELQTYRERVNAVTPEDVQRVAREYLHPDRLSIVLVGDASVFAKQLPGVGFDQFERIPINELDLASVDLRRHSSPGGRLEPAGFHRTATTIPIEVGSPDQAPSSDRPTGISATQLIDKAVRAKGGLEKLRSVHTLRTVADTIIEAADGAVSVPTTTRIRYPGSFRIDTVTAAGPLSQVFNSGEYWVQDARGIQVAPPAPAAADVIRASIQRDSIALLLALADGKVSARRGADVVIAGQTLPAVDVQLEAGPLTLVMDPQTGLIVRERYRWQPDSQVTEEVFADYRDVDGLQIAFLVTVRRPGAPVIKRIIRSFEPNVLLDPSVFARPS